MHVDVKVMQDGICSCFRVEKNDEFFVNRWMKLGRNLIRIERNVYVCVYLCIVGQITDLKRNGISYEKSVRCFLIGGGYRLCLFCMLYT